VDTFFRAIPTNPANTTPDQAVRARFGVHAGHRSAARPGKAEMTENADSCRQLPTKADIKKNRRGASAPGRGPARAPTAIWRRFNGLRPKMMKNDELLKIIPGVNLGESKA